MTRLRRLLLLLLSQLQDRAWMILLIALGCGMVTQAVREAIGWRGAGLEWGVGVAVFGALTLTLRSRTQPK